MNEKNHAIYLAATNPVLAVRLCGAPSFPRPGYPEELRWTRMQALDVWELQEAIYTAIKKLPERLSLVTLQRFAYGRTLAECQIALGVTTRERVRQLEAKALRELRHFIGEQVLGRLRVATEIIPIPGSALDPDWIDTKEAASLTGYARSHIRWLSRQGHVISQVNPLNRSRLQISRKSLEAYVRSRPGDGRTTGNWEDSHEHKGT